jgi:putative sigma-54 modulation protein
MRLELTGRNFKITPAVRQLTDDCLGKLDRLLHDRALSLQVVLFEDKYRQRVEMTLHARGERFFHGTGSGRDWETSLNQALGKVNQQARKMKGKWDDGKRRSAAAAKEASAEPRPERGARGRRGQAETAPEHREVRVIRARRYDVRPMSVDAAVHEVAKGDASFLVFRNDQTDIVSVLFRRPDGNLGLIEPDA